MPNLSEGVARAKRRADYFVVHNRRIVTTDVWNDIAEMLRRRHGTQLDEASFPACGL
jgi:hypothetical protein